MSAIITELSPAATIDFVTVFTQTGAAGKVFNRDDAGNITKESSILSFATGQVHYVPDPDSFAAILQMVTENNGQALMLGYIPGTEDGTPYELTSKRDYLDRTGLGQDWRGDIPPLTLDFVNNRMMAARLKANVVGSSWIMLDRDLTAGMPEWLSGLSQDDWIEQVATLLPGLRECGKVITASSSGRLVVDGIQEQTKNFHCYLQMQEPADLERVGSAMLINSFDYDLGFHKPVGSGDTRVPWSIFDPTTFSRERLCYEAKPVIWGPGLGVAPADIQVFQGNRLDTSFVPTPEGSRHGLSMYEDGSGCTLTGSALHLDQVVDTQAYGQITVRQFRDDHDMPEKLRCQAFNRPESLSMNGYLQKLDGDRVLFFDNGMRLKMVTRVDPNEMMGGIELQVQTPEASHQVVTHVTGAVSYQVDDIKQVDLIGDVFLSLPEIQDLHLINYQDTLYRYERDRGGYKACEGTWLTNRITKLVKKCFSLDARTGLPVKGIPGRNTVNSVVGCIMADVHEENWTQTIPFYRHGEAFEGQVGADKLIVFRNGSLDIETGVFEESSPELFVLNPLPYDYDPNTGRPERFLQFLEEIWPDDKASHDLLQEVFGYLISGETNMQKIFTLIGVRRGGKGVIGRLIKAIIGGDGMAGSTLHNVSTQFGMQALLDKKVWLIADARVGKHIDQAAVVERLLTISGEDVISVPRKNRMDWTGTLGCRTVIMSNVMPMLFEPSGALAARLVTLNFSVSFEGREDIYLEQKLLNEISGIVNWALDGLARLRKTNRFTECAATAQMKDEFEQLSNPLHGFAGVVVREKRGCAASCADVYALWNSFRNKEGMTIGGSKQSFGHLLKTVYPNVHRIRTEFNGKRQYVYDGLEMGGIEIEGMQ